MQDSNAWIVSRALHTVATVKSARIHTHGDPHVITVDDVPIPRPGPGEVLVTVAATSFNRVAQHSTVRW